MNKPMSTPSRVLFFIILFNFFALLFGISPIFATRFSQIGDKSKRCGLRLGGKGPKILNGAVFAAAKKD
jgi:hypothetical protein